MKLHPFSRVWIFLCKALEPYTLLFCKKCQVRISSQGPVLWYNVYLN